ENYCSSLRNTVEILNQSIGEWEDASTLNHERGDKQLVALDGKIYAIRGESKVNATEWELQELPELGNLSQVLDSVEVLDPAGEAECKQLGGMPEHLFRLAASEWEVEGEEGFIFVFGRQVGYSTDYKCFCTTDTVLVFNATHANTKGDTASSTSTVTNGTGTAMGTLRANTSNGTEVVVQVETNASIADLFNATETDIQDQTNASIVYLSNASETNSSIPSLSNTTVLD
ncbi:hypothetical protein ACHAWF_001467, partial [Thalassiosira exigua]